MWLRPYLARARRRRSTSSQHVTERSFIFILFDTPSKQIMSFSIAAIKSICKWDDISDCEVRSRWGSFTNDQVARRICRHAGVPLAAILGTKGNLENMCSALCDVLLEQVCRRRVTCRLLHQQLYAALWSYILPEAEWHRARAHPAL